MNDYTGYGPRRVLDAFPTIESRGGAPSAPTPFAVVQISELFDGGANPIKFNQDGGLSFEVRQQFTGQMYVTFLREQMVYALRFSTWMKSDAGIESANRHNITVLGVPAIRDISQLQADYYESAVQLDVNFGVVVESNSETEDKISYIDWGAANEVLTGVQDLSIKPS